jgi:hypothetical protein
MRTVTHYEYRPVWPSDYEPQSATEIQVLIENADVLHSEDDEDTRECHCGTVSWDRWNECNDLAFICPDYPDQE